MLFKRFINFILSNRFMRFLSLLVLYAIIIIPTFIVGLNIDDTRVLFMPTIIFVVCLLGQILGDIMNVETWFNNVFVTFLKRLIFFIGVLIATFIGMALIEGGRDINSMIENNASLFEIGMNTATIFAAPIVFVEYVFFYIKHSKSYHSANNKKIIPFFFLIGYALSVILGIVTILILTHIKINPRDVTLVFGLINAAMIVIPIIVSIITKIWVFEEEAVVYYNSSSNSTYSNNYSNDSEYQRFRIKCCNCVHVRSCRVVANDTWGDKRNADYCNLTGKEIYSIYSDSCSNFEDRC